MPIEVEEIRSFIVVMKGHECTGKSMLAWQLAKLLGRGCVLLSYDDVAACTHEMPSSEGHDDICYRILCQLAYTELSAKIASYPCIIIDSSLPLRRYLDQVLRLKEAIKSADDEFTASLPVMKNASAAVFVVECRPRNKSEWRRWFDCRASGATTSVGSYPYKPSSWKEMQEKILEQHDYDIGDVPHLVVDTTNPRKTVEDLATDVIQWMLSCFNYTVNTADSQQSFEEFAAEWVASTLLKSLQDNLLGHDENDDDEEDEDEDEDVGAENEKDTGGKEAMEDGERVSEHHLHSHPLCFSEDFIDKKMDGNIKCTLCSESICSSFYSCSGCQFYLHKSCAKLPERIEVPFHDHEGFVLYVADQYPSNEEKIHSRECVLCDGTSGVLYKCHTCSVKLHQKCAELPHLLKHPCHEQHPLQLRIEDINSFRRYQFFCFACGFQGHDAFYFCKECDYHCHVKCTLYLESSVLHRRHWDPLILSPPPLILSPPPKDGTDEYYCEICTERRHPEVWIYLCSKCEYEAHISCVNSDVPQCSHEAVPDSGWKKKMYVQREHGPPLNEIPASKRAWALVSSRTRRLNPYQMQEEAIKNGCIIL